MNVYLKTLCACTGLLMCVTMAEAKLSVVTTTTDLADIVSEVTGELADVQSIAKGTQDPHFVEAKPSFMVKVSQADLVFAVGMELEIGWLPSILRGARNPKVVVGGPGYLEVGPMIQALEIPTGTVTRADGDVHPDGNPHFTLDPIRVGQAAVKLAEKLGSIDAPNAAIYRARALRFQSRLETKTAAWQSRIAQSGVKEVITYHKTLTYFFDRFGLKNVGFLEPKPGIPPTSGHILGVIATIRAKKVPLILVENFFDPAVTRKILQEVPTVRVKVVPVSVGGEPGVYHLEDLYESLVQSIEGKGKST